MVESCGEGEREEDGARVGLKDGVWDGGELLLPTGWREGLVEGEKEGTKEGARVFAWVGKDVGMGVGGDKARVGIAVG